MTAVIVGISIGVVAMLRLIVGACIVLTITRNPKKRREQIHSIFPEGTEGSRDELLRMGSHKLYRLQLKH